MFVLLFVRIAFGLANFEECGVEKRQQEQGNDSAYRKDLPLWLPPLSHTLDR